MTRGFVIVSQDMPEKNTYYKCSEGLMHSIKAVMPDASVSLITNNEHVSHAWDHVIKFPHGDLAPDSDWKLINDWPRSATVAAPS